MKKGCLLQQLISNLLFTYLFNMMVKKEEGKKHEIKWIDSLNFQLGKLRESTPCGIYTWQVSCSSELAQLFRPCILGFTIFPPLQRKQNIHLIKYRHRERGVENRKFPQWWMVLYKPWASPGFSFRPVAWAGAFPSGDDARVLNIRTWGETLGLVFESGIHGRHGLWSWGGLQSSCTPLMNVVEMRSNIYW